jgi:hypothetical protein
VLATAVAGVLVAVALVAGALSGGSGDRKPQVAAKTTGAAPVKQTLPPPLLGEWKGTATQTASTRETYPAEVHLTVSGSAVGKPSGTLSEKAKGHGCKGAVTLVSRDAGNVFRYDEKPSPQAGCIDRTTVTVKPSAGGAVEFYEIYTAVDGDQGTVVGKLQRAGATP